MNKPSAVTAFLLMVSGAVCTAQTGAAAPSAGSVEGTIVFGDTQRPARFAKVSLTPVKNDSGDSLSALTKKKDGDVNPSQIMGALMSGITLLSTQTDLEGHYQLADVAPGDYYVMAVVPGYVTPGMSTDLLEAPSLKGVPTVHVEASRAARADETLERGATVSGRVVYDDGSPVTAVTVQMVSTKKKDKSDAKDVNPGQLMMAQMNGGLKIASTDDRGAFRIAGLLPGEYLVKVEVALAGNQAIRGGVINLNSFRGASKMTVYAPATQHEADAAKLELKRGEETGDIEIKVNLAGTHTVSGRLASATDHHLLNQGTITLVDTSDKTLSRSGSVQPDGSFSILYVPNGSYTLNVTEAADTVPAAKKKATGLMNFAQDKVVKSYEPVTVTEIVADHDVLGVSLEAKESDKVKPEVDLNGIFGGAVGTTP
jgi:hypothetical protein